MFNFDSSNPTILITGASRGFGHELVEQFVKENWNVIAGVRENQGRKFEALSKNLVRIKLDVNEIEDIEYLSYLLKGNLIDVIVNNAGVFFKDDFEKVSLRETIEMYRTNAIAPLLISKHLIHHVRKSNKKLIIVITGRMGSFGNKTGGESYGYRASKAAANMMVKTMAIDLKKYDIKILALHPGWIKTEMGGENALVSVVDSAIGIKNIIVNSHRYQSGGYYTYQGETLDW